MSDGIGPLVLKQILQSVDLSETCFSLLLDETTTVQNKKQMDVLLRFFSEEKQMVETRHVESFFFRQGTCPKNN